MFLFKFNIAPTSKCSYCLCHDETVEHLFIDCNEAKKLYVQIQQWSSARSITLPNPNFQTIILGVDSPLLNHLILLYKIILYKRRDTGKAPTLESYIIYVKSVMDIEWSIAKKRGRVEQCSKKWSKLTSM